LPRWVFCKEFTKIAPVYVFHDYSFPDRVCVIRYLGDNRFVAEQTLNSTMQAGDTFSCLQFQKGRELHLDDFRKADPGERFRYVVGLDSGLTTLEIM
jgi:hypothetical protein